METKAGLDIAQEGTVAVASFRGTCISDVEEIANASTRLKEYIDVNQPRRMVFDFAGVKFFSSQVLGVLLEARAWLDSHQGEMAVSSLSPQLERVFKITNLDKLFHFYPDRAAAVTRFAGQRN